MRYNKPKNKKILLTVILCALLFLTGCSNQPIQKNQIIQRTPEESCVLEFPENIVMISVDGKIVANVEKACATTKRYSIGNSDYQYEIVDIRDCSIYVNVPPGKMNLKPGKHILEF